MRRFVGIGWTIVRSALLVCGVLFVGLVAWFVLATSEYARPIRPAPADAHPAPAGVGMGEAPPKEAVVRIFEEVFASKRLDELAAAYHADAVMHDTWARCEGAPAIRDYYAKQFKYAQSIELRVKEYLQDGNRVMLRFHGVQRLKEPAMEIDLPGVLYLEFRDGKIWYQREYWDGMAFLDDAPLLGRAFRALRHYLSGAGEAPEPS